MWLDEAAVARVVAQVGAAEGGNRGQVRVHLEARCRFDPSERAEEVFGDLGMFATADGTAVLLYAAVLDRKVAVYAGPGIPGVADPAFWEPALEAARRGLAGDDLAGGLIAALAVIGEHLRTAVPGESAHGNELPDSISMA